MGEGDVADAFDAFEQAHGLRQPRGLPARQVDLARIAGDDHAAVFAEAGQEHLHLHGGRVLRLVENDRGIRQRAAAHEGERGDLDVAGLQRALDDAGVHQIEQRVVDRPQIRVDLLAQVAGQEAEALAGFHRRARQDDAVDFLALEHLDRLRHREKGLAGAGGAGAEHQRITLERLDVGVLRGGTCAHRALAQVDFVECAAAARRVVVEQRALRQRLADGAFDVAGAELAALPICS